ncbi:hypothetical protein [Roseibium salinum]|uniref:Uncharacterized protein n=1 Tax=Roseibium salinum TaxID=1604349 RepID=A0ABT3R5K6_9HYPH|nr:hypothetical protein [Roseibium sp. DSM 29163]MCX2724530.1 hypothetical protein [Roseibium sp. DSM 29163]
MVRLAVASFLSSGRNLADRLQAAQGHAAVPGSFHDVPGQPDRRATEDTFGWEERSLSGADIWHSVNIPFTECFTLSKKFPAVALCKILNRPLAKKYPIFFNNPFPYGVFFVFLCAIAGGGSSWTAVVIQVALLA